MSTGLVDIANSIVDMHNTVEWLRSSWIYQFVTSAFSEFIKWSFLESLKFKLWVMTFSFDIAANMLNSFHFSDKLSSAFGALPASIVNFLSVLKIPESLNIVSTAYLTRFVMRFLGFNN
jgi:hypothetical protein